MNMDELIARAVFKGRFHSHEPRWAWESEDHNGKEYCHRISRSALSALKEAGYVIVQANGDRWCWTEHDPEMTYPDEREWLECNAPYLDGPFVQRFDWGVTAPSTWGLFWENEDHEPQAETFDTAEQAEARRAEVDAMISQALKEAGQ